MSQDLPRRPFTELSPPPAGLVAVRASATRRRRAKSLVSGAGALGVLGVVLALVASSGPRDDTLRVTDAGPDVTSTAAPQTTETATPSASEPAPTSTPTAAPSAPGSSSVGGDGEAAATQTPDPAQVDYRTPDVTREYVSRASLTGTTVCSGSESGSTDPTLYYTVNWCHSAAVSATRGGHLLTQQICRDSSSDSTLSFDGDRELDLVVQRDDGHVVWRWSVGHPDGGSAHSLAVEREHCWVWNVSWTDVDQRGRALPHGSYTLVVTTTASELRSKPMERTDFTL